MLLDRRSQGTRTLRRRALRRGGRRRLVGARRHARVVVHGNRRPRGGLCVRRRNLLGLSAHRSIPRHADLHRRVRRLGERLIESLDVMCQLVVDVVGRAASDVGAVVVGGSAPTIGVPADFVPRAGLELILHAHDVCAGLGVRLEPDAELGARQKATGARSPSVPGGRDFIQHLIQHSGRDAGTRAPIARTPRQRNCRRPPDALGSTHKSLGTWPSHSVSPACAGRRAGSRRRSRLARRRRRRRAGSPPWGNAVHQHSTDLCAKAHQGRTLSPQLPLPAKRARGPLAFRQGRQERLRCGVAVTRE